METPNIQLYHLFRQDLHLPDGKSLELMHLLDKEYKSGVKEDIAALGRLMDARFDQIDDRLSAHDKRFDAIDKRFEAQDNKIDKSFSFLDSKMDKGFSLLDNKIDLKTAELHADIHKANNAILMWIIGLIGTLLLLFIGAAWFKK